MKYSTIPEYLEEVTSYKIGGGSMLDNFVIQFMNLFLSLGTRLLKGISDFEIHSKLYIPTSTEEQNVIVDIVSPELEQE